MKFRVVSWMMAVIWLTVALPAWADLSPAEEIRIGKEVMTEVRDLGLTRNPALEAIGAKLAKTMQRQNLTWQFWVVEGLTDYNAFAAPGGFVFISRPYFEKLNDDEAAFVIVHEMAHVDLRHHERQMKRYQKANIGNLLLRVLTNSTVIGTVADIGATAYVSRYSRALEREADFAGYKYAQQAGYDAGAAVTALSKLGKDSQRYSWFDNIYASHPVLSSREDRLAALGGKEPDVSSPPPPSSQHKLNDGLQPFDPPIPIAIRILAPDNKRWEGEWRKSFTKFIHLRVIPYGFKIAGDDLMYKPDIGDPFAAAQSREARYLLLVTVKDMLSQADGQVQPLGQPVKASLEASAHFYEVASRQEVWSMDLTSTATGVDTLPPDPHLLYPDTVIGGLAWWQVGDMANGFAKHLGAKPEAPKPVETPATK